MHTVREAIEEFAKLAAGIIVAIIPIVLMIGGGGFLGVMPFVYLLEGNKWPSDISVWHLVGAAFAVLVGFKWKDAAREYVQQTDEVEEMKERSNISELSERNYIDRAVKLSEENTSELDEKYEDVRAYVVEQGEASLVNIERQFKLGYGRVARLISQLEMNGVVSESDGTNRPRRVLE